jgi:hypothetical protein
VVEPRDDGAEEQDPFADGSEPVGTDGTVVLRPEAPAYDPKQVATLFASYAAQLGVLKRTALPGEIKALRDQLLPELVAGSVWRDVTEEQYHTLITRLQERAA